MAQHHGMISSFTTVPESPLLFTEEVHVKRARTEDTPTGHSQPDFSTVSTEMRKTVTTTCHNIINCETLLAKLQEKAKLLEEHSTKGTVP